MENQSECPICLSYVPDSQLFSLTDCQHHFCLGCCIQHIESRSSNFSEIRCPSQKCQKTVGSFDDLLPQIKNNLSEHSIKQIKSFTQYQHLQSNTHLKPCLLPNCPGYINMRLNRKECSICRTPYCGRCLKPFHLGNCILDEHDQQMRKANYQKCPNCSIWVQKLAGCQYINCKCGCAFCYVCGIRFEEDPCRMTSEWKYQDEIRSELSNLKYRFPLEKSHYVFLPIKVLLQALVFLFLTVFGSFLLLLTIILGELALIILSPIIAVFLICMIKGCQKILGILFFPLISLSLIAFFIVALVVYPFARKTYHHGIYDGLDLYLNYMSLKYIKIVSKISSY